MLKEGRSFCILSWISCWERVERSKGDGGIDRGSLTFAARIDSSRSVIQDSVRVALRDFESVSEILVRIAEETSVGCFLGKWDGMGKAMPQQTCRKER